MGTATRELNPWVAGAVIIGTLVGVAAYTYLQHGLPIFCYKDDQKITVSPGGHNKLVSYSWNCRNELFGIDIGPFGWAATGLELVPADDTLPRRGFPPGTMLAYTESAKTESNRETPPTVRVVWDNPTYIQVFHSPNSEVVSRGGMRFYAVEFIEEAAK